MIRQFSNVAVVILLMLMTEMIPSAKGDSPVKGNVSLQRFHSTGLDAKGVYTWELDGDRATMRGSVTELKEARLRFHKEGEADFLVFSPECQYLDSLREVKSSSVIELKSSGLEATGIGYDIFLNEKVVRIRSMVKVVFQREDGAGALFPLRKGSNGDDKK